MNDDRPVSASRRTLAMTSILLAVTAVVLDGAMLYSSLPIIASELDVEAAIAVRVITAYQMVMLVTLIPFSAIAEKRGKKQVFMVGLLLFGMASVACSLSQSLLELAIARGLQGLAASAVTSVNLALIRGLYPAHFSGRGFGMSALVAALSMSAGPILSAVFLDRWPWQYLFFINLPIVTVASTLAALAIPYGKSDREKRPSMCALLRIKAFNQASLTSTLAYMSQGMMLTALPFLLYVTLSRSITESGFLLMLWSLMVALTAPATSRFSEAYYPGLLRLGLLLMGLGQGLLVLLPPEVTAVDLVWRAAISGVGFGIFQAPNICMLFRYVPIPLIGGASGVIATSRLLGQLIGSAMTASFFYAWEQHGPAIALGVSCVLSISAYVQTFSKR